MNVYEITIQLTAALIASLGYALLYNTRGKKMIISAFGGIVSWGSYILLGFSLVNEPLKIFISSIIVSVHVEIFARIEKTPTTTFFVPAIITLVPGGMLYYTMSYAFSGNVKSCYNAAISTIELAFAIACGIIVVKTVSQVISAIIRRCNIYMSLKAKNK